LNITQDKLKKLSDLLTILIPGESVSPRFLARKTKINNKDINLILMELAHRNLLGVNFIIYCNNEDPDMVHGFEFESEDEMLDFIRNQNKCKHCDEQLVTNNIRVAFIRKQFNQGEVYG
jgi:hypothetical protein